jgi:hypothetical protein
MHWFNYFPRLQRSENMERYVQIMKTQIWFSVRDVLKKPGTFIAFTLQLLVSLIFISLIFVYFTHSGSNFREIKRHSDLNLIYFQEVSEGGHQLRPEINENLRRYLNAREDKYYSLVTLYSDEFTDFEVLVGLGAFTKALNKDIRLKADKDFNVFIGNKVKDYKVGDSISFGKLERKSLTITSRLPANTSYLFRGTSQSLDNSVLILSELDSMYHYYGGFEETNIVLGTHLLAPDNAVLLDFVFIAAENDITLNAVTMNSYSNQIERNHAVSAMFFYLIASTFTLVGIVVNVLQLIEINKYEYAIHLLYGARIQHLNVRTAFYVFWIVSLPLCIFWCFLVWIGFPLPSPLLILSITILTFLLAWVPLLNLKHRDLFSYLRSDEK